MRQKDIAQIIKGKKRMEQNKKWDRRKVLKKENGLKKGYNSRNQLEGRI